MNLPGTAGAGPALALLLPAALLATSAPAAGQSSAPPSLEAAEAAADSGAVDRARELLAAWREARREGAAPGQRDRARFLEARLTADPDSARRLYARLAVEAGSQVGARARLRLAQLRLARGDARAALADLELLRADFPGSPAAAASWLWTGRAHRAAGAPDPACRAFGRAERAADAAGLADLRRQAAEARSGCGAAAGGASPDAVPAPRWVVQLGAFRDAGSAEHIRRRAEEEGFRARVVAGGGEGLHRVRVGRFRERAAAEAAARRLEDRGFRALVVEAGAGSAGGP